jgi:hypothetical protein
MLDWFISFVTVINVKFCTTLFFKMCITRDVNYHMQTSISSSIKSCDFLLMFSLTFFNYHFNFLLMIANSPHFHTSFPCHKFLIIFYTTHYKWLRFGLVAMVQQVRCLHIIPLILFRHLSVTPLVVRVHGYINILTIVSLIINPVYET